MSRKSKKYPNEFRSGFEYDVSKQLQPYGFSYEPFQIPYRIERKYTPDFVYERNDKQYLIECKGYFRSGDTQKYRSVSNCLGSNQELIFILMKPNQKVSKSTKNTMAQWCDKHEILWYTMDTLKELVDYVTDTRRN
jgi:restriction endonuclease